MKPGAYSISSGFGSRTGGFHRGIDFAAKDGAPIYAAQAGEVVHIGAAQGFGQWIVVDHPAADGAGTTVYGHMWDAFATGLKQGQRVEAGQLIAYVGSNGQSSGPHLHFEVHPTVWRAGSQIDPLPWLAGAREVPTTQEGSMTVSGDPVWLEDVLRAALGDRLVVEPGWKNRGAGGTMGVIWGTMIHHTGNDDESVAVIRDGVRQPSGWLPGPLSQGLIKPDGTFHLIAVGPCNHAGGGNYGTLTDGNRCSIGFECAYDGSGPWPQKQVITMRDAAAAVSKKLGKRAVDSVCGHKEYAKPAGRKPDPGNMDMDWLRGEVQKDLDGFVFPGEPLEGIPPVEKPTAKDIFMALTDKEQNDLYNAVMAIASVASDIQLQLRGPGLQGWPQLGNDSEGRHLTLVDAVAKIKDGT